MSRCANCGHENRLGARFCEACGVVLSAAAPPGEQRKTVTLLFCDVTGSTALGERLDPESLRGVMARYFDAARIVVERHGGSVEKFIGDAVMAVFGIPVLHEDDALRAVRAAAELRDGLAELNERLLREYGTTLELRIGVNTGEVVTGTQEHLATGDAVNVAARLEQAAQPGEILIGAETRALVRDSAVVDAVDSMELKGKAAPVAAYRLVSVRSEPPSRRRTGAMVGRTRELGRLQAALAQAEADRSCQLFTVLGAAGVGKSRLAYEFLTQLDGATVVRGGCLSYGDGITYWPVVEVVKQLLGSAPEQRLAALGLDASASRAIQAVLGEGGVVASVEEIAWAMRVLLEAVAADAPLVVVLDDIHWGEEAFLDLVDHVADLSRDAPLLLLCMARPELLDRRPNWGGGKLNATTVLLEPLAADDADALVASLLDGAPADDVLRARILNAAEGNPLFVEEMVALVRESPDDAVAVPATIQALLAARLDQLDPVERDVLGRGSVEGRVFHRGAVQALSPDGSQLVAPLTALVRRELLRPDGPQFPGEDAFRFRHLLIRDAAYEALPKATRADLHARFAGWIAERAADLVELDEVVGYHLERAYRYRVELGPADTAALELSERAAERLAAAGAKAAARSDVRAATSLFARAVDLLPAGDARRGSLLPPLGRALFEAGQWDRADEVLSEAVSQARAAGDRRMAAEGNVALTHLRLFMGSAITHQMARSELADAVSVFQEFDDEAGLARALGLAGQLRMWAGEAAAAIEDLERAAQYARAAGDRLQEIESLHYVLISSVHGPITVTSGLERAELVGGQVEGDHRLKVTVLRARAVLEAMRGSFDVARELIGAAVALADQLGLEVDGSGAHSDASEIELLAGRPADAERALRISVDALERRGDVGHLATVAPLLADVLYLQGRPDEAMPLTELVARSALADDLDPQVAWRRVQAKVLAQRGDFENAEPLARKAIELAERSDYINAHARAIEDLAEVLRLAGRSQEAVVELDRATGLHEQKGNVVSAAKTRALREQLSR
ncbi:MAG: AAA family ATPase [Actinomycetota bacterium]|nr:AAA family ATPase [Actinomycetota bacterium]